MTESVRHSNESSLVKPAPLLASFPKEPRENLAWRREILLRARRDLVYRAKVKELFHRDVLFAFNAFFFTLDVRKRPLHNQPFCTYPYQDDTILDLVEAINGKEDLPIEKSRDMGASWLVILTYLWFWLDPKGGTDFLLGSRVEDYVDKKGDMRTLMEKARYGLYKLPLWLRPEGFNSKKHDNFMKLSNPATGASITGESNNANFSTGGRYASILYDEFAKWEGTDRSAWTAGGDATPCRIPVSTAFGASGQFYDLVQSGKRKIRLHWSKHPEKGEGLYCVWPKPVGADELVDSEHCVGLRSPWYDKECERRSPLEIAQELDMDYIGAGVPVFDGRAGKRIAALLKVVREPVGFYELLLEEKKLRKLAFGPRSFENVLVVWEEPQVQGSYVLACDVAEGKEAGDYGIVKVMNRETKSCVASFHTRYDEIYLSLALYLAWEHYRAKSGDTPWWAVETTGLGLTVFDRCVEAFEMSNAFMMQKYDTTNNTVSYRKGWWTSSTSKNVLISDLKSWLIDGTGWVDLRCTKELTTFVRDKNGKPGAKGGCNDDEVMAWGIALQVDLACPERAKEKAPRKTLDEEMREPLEKFRKELTESIESLCEAQAIASLARAQAFSHPMIDYVP
jgi:hypothetical protein